MASAAARVLVAERHRWRAIEALPWVLAVAAFLVFPDYAYLGTQVLILILFALSLDLILGYAGIVTLGHAAYFGLGAYVAGMLSAHLGWHEPLTGLIAAAAAAAVFGWLSGMILLRYHGLALLMLTLALGSMVMEAANALEEFTGGFDGLYGITPAPLFGRFANDLYGHTYYWYALAVLFLSFLLCRRIVHSPFGLSLKGLRGNERRMRAIGCDVLRRKVAIFTVSTGLAGLAGGLFAQANAFVSLDVLSFAPLGHRPDRAGAGRQRPAVRRVRRRHGALPARGPAGQAQPRVLAVRRRPGPGARGAVLARRPARAVGPGAPPDSTGDIPKRAVRSAADGAPPALETRALHKSFGGLAVTAGVDLRLERGSRQALIGPNGAGKTTLLNLISGALAPDAGDVFLDGCDVTRLPQHARARLGLARTFQINQLFPELAVVDHVALALGERQGSGRRFWRPLGADGALLEKAFALLEELGLADHALAPVGTLPYGRQRLVEIALALAARPKVLLLDEPAAGVPAAESHLILDAIAALPAEIAVLIVEHDMDVVFRFAHRITVMAAGAILTEGTPEAIAADERVRAVYLGRRQHG